MSMLALSILLAIVCVSLAVFLILKILENKKLKEQLFETEVENRSLLQSQESSQENLQQLKEQFENSFRSLAAQALESNNQQFLTLAKTTLEKESSLAKSDLDKRQQSINSVVTPLRETLDKYQAQAAQLEKERQRSYMQVESELKKVFEVSQQLSRETGALKDALKKPHVRGRWGEVQLKNCIELAGMSEHCDVNFQHSTSEDEKTLIPDMTVRMPGGRLVIVDAKTPLDAFISSLEANTDEEREAEIIRHGRHVKDHVKKLASKSYSQAFSESADFTVMFLPNESFLYAALEAQPDLMEYAIEQKILIATPPTLIGLLKVIQYGWNEEKLAENAEKISAAGKELHKRICDFVEAYVAIGKHLDKAKAEYETGLNRLESRVLVQTKRLEKLGAKSKKSLAVEPSDNLLVDGPELEA